VSELNEMGCAGFAEVTAELALGALTGRERAEALAHLDHCAACQERVRRLTVTGEGLLQLLPAGDPPPGFEARVLERLAPAAQSPGPGSRRSLGGRWRRFWRGYSRAVLRWNGIRIALGRPLRARGRRHISRNDRASSAGVSGRRRR
jgi:anti-sigma-K factor RskA